MIDLARAIAPLFIVDPIKVLPRNRRGKKSIEKADPPVPVVAEDLIKPLLLDPKLIVDGCGRADGRALTHGGLHQLAVVGLLSASAEIRQVETTGQIVRLKEAAPAW